MDSRYRIVAAVVIAFLATTFMAGQALAVSPSFDCNKAATPDEIAICSSNELSEMDNVIAAGYAYLGASLGRPQARSVALPLLKLRRTCGADTNCILARQIDTVKTFQQLGAPVTLPAWATDGGSQTAAADGMPKVVGQCTTSTIAQIAGRLEGDNSFESGTAVNFANGGWQVSYDKIWAIVRSRVGDPVTICLVELPQDCPPGDDRGKIYTTTNQRTGDSWTLPDSQHSCGGA